MKKTLLIIFLISHTLPSYPISSQINKSISAQEEYYVAKGLGDVTIDLFLFTGGSFLILKQLPRLAGTSVEFNAPTFTKVGASILFFIGAIGDTMGAHELANTIRYKLNHACDQA